MKQNKVPKNEYIRKPVSKTNPYKEDTIYTDMGQWKYPGQVTKIPSGDITMQGVPYPVYGQDNLGYSQMMYPGMDYTFPGQYVTEYPMAQDGREINSLEADLITKVLMNRNRDKDFIQRAYALGQNPGMFSLPDPDQFGSRMSHKMGWGEDDQGQAYMFPTVMNPGNENIKVPNQYADYISSIGYKKEAGIPYQAYGGDPSLPNITGHYPFGGIHTKTHTHMQIGGYNIVNPHIAAAETTGHYKREIPSLDTLKKQQAARMNRPWNQWSPEEKEQYIKNPPKKMSPAQAEEWNKRAQEWSSAQAKKENIEDFVKEGTRQALVDNPMWNTATSFTPIGALYSLVKGAGKAGPDIYKTIKNPAAAANYVNIVDDVLSMAHIPEANIGSKTLANIKNLNIAGTKGLKLGDIKKLYGTKKKFQKDDKEGTNKTYPSGMTDDQIKAYIDKSYTPVVHFQEGGGWLDEYFRGGSGPMTHSKLKKKARQEGTSKNIQSSINKLFLRNYDIFGPSGKNIYNPKSKYQSGGGWLDNLD